MDQLGVEFRAGAGGTFPWPGQQAFVLEAANRDVTVSDIPALTGLSPAPR